MVIAGRFDPNYTIGFPVSALLPLTLQRQEEASAVLLNRCCPAPGPIRTADHTDDETVLIVGTFTYAGTGWKTTGDALLANTAADQAANAARPGTTSSPTNTTTA